MKGGVLGLGCNDKKLIAVLCTRTKSQLQRAARKYRALYWHLPGTFPVPS